MSRGVWENSVQGFYEYIILFFFINFLKKEYGFFQH